MKISVKGRLKGYIVRHRRNKWKVALIIFFPSNIIMVVLYISFICHEFQISRSKTLKIGIVIRKKTSSCHIIWNVPQKPIKSVQLPSLKANCKACSASLRNRRVSCFCPRLYIILDRLFLLISGGWQLSEDGNPMLAEKIFNPFVLPTHQYHNLVSDARKT